MVNIIIVIHIKNGHVGSQSLWPMLATSLFVLQAENRAAAVELDYQRATSFISTREGGSSREGESKEPQKDENKAEHRALINNQAEA